MNTKLTIRLNQRVIARAKNYAQNNKTSISKMVEVYLSAVTQSVKHDIEITPLVESLSGVITLSKNFSHKDKYKDYLYKKYK
jgi:hypothetical protein